LKPENKDVCWKLMRLNYDMKLYETALRYADQMVDTDKWLLFDLLELSMLTNNQDKFAVYKKQLEEQKDLFKDMGEVLANFFEILNERTLMKIKNSIMMRQSLSY